MIFFNMDRKYVLNEKYPFHGTYLHAFGMRKLPSSSNVLTLWMAQKGEGTCIRRKSLPRNTETFFIQFQLLYVTYACR